MAAAARGGSGGGGAEACGSGGRDRVEGFGEAEEAEAAAEP
jgi:hypothetical protein